MGKNIWEFVREEDGTYSVFHRKKLLASKIPEDWFEHQICVDYGFCQDELDEIRRQIKECGKCTLLP
jgi:hypothetical protein